MLSKVYKCELHIAQKFFQFAVLYENKKIKILPPLERQINELFSLRPTLEIRILSNSFLLLNPNIEMILKVTPPLSLKKKKMYYFYFQAPAN